MKNKLRRILSVILTAVIVLSAAPMAGIDFTLKAKAIKASGQLNDYISYTFDEATGTLTISGSGYMPLYGEMESPFYYDSSIINVIIEDGVKSIGDYAFYYCSNLINIEIPNSVTSIGNYAFATCSNLTSIEIPNSVTSIGSNVFRYCYKLTNVEIPDSVTSISRYLFWGCDSLTSIKIPDGITSIDDYAFSFCDNLTSVEIPDSVTNIGDEAFYNCESLAGIEIPDSVTSIGDSAFSSCKSLTGITIPDGITSIRDDLFYNCINLTAITIPDGVTSIGDYAFCNCHNLTGITIPDRVTSIGDFAFAACYKLPCITIPDGVTSIGTNLFSSCNRLTSITVDENNAVYDSRDNCNAVIETATNTLICACKNSVIPDGVTGIRDDAFYNCANLTSIEIPDSVTSIGDYTFRDCYNLSGITIGNGVISIGNYAFSGCERLTSIEIPDSVTSVGDYTFSDCSGLTSITIGSGVVSIGNGAFEYYTHLVSITVDENNSVYDSRDNCNAIIETATDALICCCKNTVIPDSVKSIGYGAFDGCITLTSIEIPEGITSIGDRAFANCDNLTSVTIPETVTSIGDYAFYDCINLTNIEIPDSITSIGNYVFYRCKSLTSIEIRDSITSIGIYAFGWCNSLASIEIPDSVTSIGEYAFANCPNLTSVTIGNGVTSIGDSAFLDCESLTGIEIPDSVTSIGWGTFWSCTNLSDIKIPDGVTSLGGGVFYNCYKITSMAIPDGITSIGRYMFYGCTNLSNIEIPDSVTSIEEHAFYACSRLTSIDIPDTVTGIDDYAFYSCTRLTSIELPDGIPSIGSSAFKFCIQLTSITIPDSVTSIGDRAFNGCNSLTDIYYSGTRAQWNDITVGVLNESLLNATVHFPMITVTLNPQGGSVTPSSVQVEAGESAALPEAERAGFTFLGWSADSSAKTGKMTYKPAEDVTLYAIWKLNSSKLDDSDFYSFANSADSFGCDTYTVSDGDFEKLAGYVMTQYGESSEITKNTISMLRSEKDKPWLGSCYGMAATIMLDKFGRIGFNENFDTDKRSMADVDSPTDNPEALSAINYYQLSQFLGFIKPNISFGRSRNWTGGLRNLVQLSKQDSGFMFIYNYEKDGSTLAHAIIIRGYASEDDSFYYLNAYDSRSPVSDITVQVAKDYSDCAVLGENGTEEPVQIELMTDFSGFDAVDIDGPDNDMILKPEVSAIISDSTVLNVLAFGDVTITNADGETITVSDGDVSGTMDIISDKIIVNESGNGVPASATLSFEVADSDYFTFESTAENMSVSILNDSIYASAETKNADSIVISQDEGVSIDGENAEYKAYFTLDDDYCDMLKLEGTALDGVDITFGSEGVKFSGVQNDICKLTSYSGLTDEEMFEFSSDGDEILITSGKTGIDVLAKDANGAYTTSLINKLKVKVNGLNLMHKEEGRIRTIITNADAKKCSYAYSSSNPGVAEVDDEGNITTKAPGKTTITCVVADENGRTAESTCTVKVKFTFWQWVIWLLLLGFLRL